MAVETLDLTITRPELIELWECGVINNLAYVYLALKSEGHEPGKQINLDYFAGRWTGTGERAKTLTRRQVLNAVAILDEKRVIAIGGSVQLQLEVF